MRRSLDVLAIGNINIDLSFFVKEAPGPDSEVLADDFRLFHGGSASNFAVGAARLGLRSGIIGCVGRDGFGEAALAALRSEGVSVERVSKSGEKGTGASCVIVESDRSRRMMAYRGANEGLGGAVARLLSPGCADILQLCNVSGGVLKSVIEKRGDSFVSLDPGGASAELGAGELEGVDMLILNESECRHITGEGWESGARILSEEIGIVVVKRGSKGCFAVGRGEVHTVPAFEVDVVDTTGAGDAFDAGFVAAVARGKGMLEAAVWGSAAAALKIRKKGARTGLPGIDELSEFLSLQWKQQQQ